MAPDAPCFAEHPASGRSPSSPTSRSVFQQPARMGMTRKEKKGFCLVGGATYILISPRPPLPKGALVSSPLLSDAELAEDLIKNVLTGRHAEDLAEMGKSLLELDGHEFP